MSLLNQCHACRYGVTPFTPLKGLLIQGPIFVSFFLAVRLSYSYLYCWLLPIPISLAQFDPLWYLLKMQIRHMVDNVPSLKTGGAFWFTDLTTPDAMMILPVLTALTFWITVEVRSR